MKKKVIIAVGSTGGHFFPGLRIARYLREKYKIESVFLGPVKSKFQNILQEEKFSFVNLPVSFACGNMITTVSCYYTSMMKAVIKSFIFLCRARPKLVVGTGSFGSFPACISAYFLRIPLFLHEQNIVSGKANKFLAKFAQRIFLAFPNSSNRDRVPITPQSIGKISNPLEFKKIPRTKVPGILRIPRGKFFQCRTLRDLSNKGTPCFSSGRFISGKTLVVGNPVGKFGSDIGKKDCYERFGLDKDKKTLLIFGGSQGAFSLNTWVTDVLTELVGWQVIHITGEADCERIKGKYEKLKISSVVLPFLFPMDYAYSISDLAIARGGALSLSELSFWGIPSLIAPYSYAKDNHQEHNALYFQEKGGAYLLKKTDMQKKCTPPILQELLNNPDKLKKMSENMKKIMPNDALEKICEEIDKYIK